MKLSEQEKKHLIENNQKITALLKENEQILRRAGYHPPEHNYPFTRTEKIGFPSGYIRTVTTFKEKYHLSEICPRPSVRHNITYALEASDLINFIINRINIWGSVETIFYKLAIVNLVSIIEALLLEAANNICFDTKSCKNARTCTLHFSREERNYAKCALDKLISIGVLDFDEKQASRAKEIIDYRNRIHIRLSDGNELKLDDFTIKLYNEVIRLLQNIDEQVYQKAVPMYFCGTDS